MSKIARMAASGAVVATATLEYSHRTKTQPMYSRLCCDVTGVAGATEPAQAFNRRRRQFQADLEAGS